MRLTASDIRELQILKYYRLVRKWACKTYELKDADLELLIYLDCKGRFTRNDFIDGVPKGDMVSPQIQELFMLVEFLSENVDKLKSQMEQEIPMIQKNDMVIQFHEERIIDLEEKNGTY